MRQVLGGCAAGRYDAGPGAASAEAGRRIRTRRQGGLPVLRADERDSGSGSRRAGDCYGDASCYRRQAGIDPYILVAAAEAGVKEMYRVGGAQAVAALAYGTASIPPVDKICGPGNIYVALAKRAVFGAVDIDSIAGPSEIVVLADDTADPAYIAADLLSQAEHDEMASAILVTTSASWRKRSLPR